MYSESTINRKLAAFTAKYGWTPVRHSIGEVEKATNYIRSKMRHDDKGEYFDDDQWTPSIKQWVLNERAMCAIDCAYFLTRYYKIAADNALVRFTFRSGQQAFYKVCQQLEQKGVSIEIQCLKARQQGISTLVEGMMTHRALFVPGAKCSIGSANPQKTEVMMGMMYTALDHIPWWLSPTQTKDKRSGNGILEFSHVGTSIVIQSGSMRGGIGQGTTPTAIHLSEVCDYTDPTAQIEEGLFKAVHASPEIFMVLESTGNGSSGWWAEQWRSNKEKYWKGDSRLLPLFLPWFMTPELYPTSTWIKKFPVKEGWIPRAETRVMIAKCEAYVRMTEILRLILPENWTLPIEQQWFWEFNYFEAKDRRKEKSWLRQMPCDDYEALIGENDSVFDQDTIVGIDKYREKSIEVYGILGEGIAEKHDPPPFDVVDQPAIVCEWITPKEERLEWVLMPLQSARIEDSKFDPLKKLIIYRHPEYAADYSIGVDTGTGVGGDRSIISVARTGRDAADDLQVAEFAADDITNVEIYAWVAAIAAYYARFMEDGRHPKLCIEQRRKYGDTCQHQLNLMGMRRHHEFIEYDKKGIRKSNPNSRLGWYTNAWSRPMLLGMFKYAVEGGWYKVNSRWLMEEIAGFEQTMSEAGKTKMDHASGKHDDRIFAAAMSYFTLHDLDVMIERSKKKYNIPQEEGYDIDYSPFLHQVTNDGGDFFERVA